MTVGGYQSIQEDVKGNKDVLRYNPYRSVLGKGKHAKLYSKFGKPCQCARKKKTKKN